MNKLIFMYKHYLIGIIGLVCYFLINLFQDIFFSNITYSINYIIASILYIFFYSFIIIKSYEFKKILKIIICVLINALIIKLVNIPYFFSNIFIITFFNQLIGIIVGYFIFWNFFKNEFA